MLASFFYIFWGETLSSNNILLGSCHVTFHSPLTVQSYERQLNILTNWRTGLGMDSVLKGRFIVNRSVESMNPDTTPNRKLLDFSVFQAVQHFLTKNKGEF